MSPTSQGQMAIADLAQRHGFSIDAVSGLAQAIALGHGRQAQFSHSELGGLGQWAHGGMLMIGDMFNNSLKSRVSGLADDIVAAMGQGDLFDAGGAAGQGDKAWWPAEWGAPSAVGSQNSDRYAIFPEKQRLAIHDGQAVSLYDTGHHQISGISQQQGGKRNLQFTSQHGPVTMDAFTVIAGGPADPEPSPPRETQSPTASTAQHDIVAAIEGLAALRDKGLLTDDEFTAKKTELLARL